MSMNQSSRSDIGTPRQVHIKVFTPKSTQVVIPETSTTKPRAAWLKYPSSN